MENENEQAVPGEVSVRIINVVTDGRGTHKPRSIVPFSAEEASRLIKLGAAEIVEEEPASAPAGGVEEEVEKEEAGAELSELLGQEGKEAYSQEQLQEFADTLYSHKLPGVSDIVAAELVNSGFYTLEDLAKADLKKLVDVKFIGKKSAEKIIKKAKELLR